MRSLWVFIIGFICWALPANAIEKNTYMCGTTSVDCVGRDLDPRIAPAIEALGLSDAIPDYQFFSSVNTCSNCAINACQDPAVRTVYENICKSSFDGEAACLLLKDTREAPELNACKILVSPKFNPTTFKAYYDQVCENNCQDRETTAGIIALIEGNRYASAGICEQYIKDFVANEGDWTVARYKLLWQCKRALLTGYSVDQLKTDLTWWVRKSCTGLCNDIVDTDIKAFCEADFPWPMNF